MAKLSVEGTRLLAIWALRRMGVSYRAIGELFRQNHETIKNLYRRACEEINSEKSAILPYRWRGKSKREVYVGGSSELEELYAKEYQRPTGGGWQTPKLSGSDDA